MSLLDEIYMSGGKAVILNVVELRSVGWGSSICLVSDYVEHTFITEDGRTIVAEPSGFAAALPKRDSSTKNELRLAFDGVRRQATQLVRAAKDAGEEIQLTYRVYLSTNKNAPSEEPYEMTVKQYSADGQKIEVLAGFFEFVDMKYPRLVYDGQTTRGLRYVDT